MAHRLVDQLRFTRLEFLRGIRGVSDLDASRRLMPMNCISWNVGHLSWQEQRYFLQYGGANPLYPEIDRDYASGAPASTPSLSEMIPAWKAITSATDAYLDSLSSKDLLGRPKSGGREIARTRGDMLQRVIYHYWYHNGENQAVRQQLGHSRLPQFVGDLDKKAPFRA